MYLYKKLFQRKFPLTLTLQCLVSTKRSDILKQASSFQLHVNLTMSVQQTPGTKGLREAIYQIMFHTVLKICRGVFKTLSNIYMELFLKIINSQRLQLVFAKAPSQIFDTIVNTLLTTVFLLLALKKFNIFSFAQKRIQQPVETFGKIFLAKTIIFAKIFHRSFNTS